MKIPKIDETIHNLIVDTINSGICADVPERMHYTDADNHNFILLSTDGYDLIKTIRFIKDSIEFRNQGSKHHIRRK
jgi:hypothetical protein